MSVTLDELSGVMCQHMTYNNERERQAALAAVLDRLADEYEAEVCPHLTGKSEGGNWLRSIAHPPAPKPVPDVEGAKAQLKGIEDEVQSMREHADTVDAMVDSMKAALEGRS